MFTTQYPAVPDAALRIETGHREWNGQDICAPSLNFTDFSLQTFTETEKSSQPPNGKVYWVVKDPGNGSYAGLKQAEKTAPEQLKGRKRGQRLYQDRQIAELPPGTEPLPSNVHAWLRMPALPTEESNAIVLGKVTDRRAVLMDDRFGIYSEFSIKISEIFKDDLNGFFIDQVITASRPGGAVRFPSGKIQKYTIAGQGYPQQGKGYVLFLKRDELGDYSILTGYEVTGSVVQPLDGKRNLPKNESDNQFGIYRGASVESFRNALKTALQQAKGVASNDTSSQKNRL